MEPEIYVGVDPAALEEPVRHVWFAHVEDGELALSVSACMCGAEEWDGSRSFTEQDVSVPLCQTCLDIHDALCRIAGREYRRIASGPQEVRAIIERARAEAT